MNIRWKLYRQIVESAWVQSFAYRADIFWYRGWDVVAPLCTLLLWSAVFSTRNEFQGYTKETMLTYVLISTLCLVLSQNWLHKTIGGDIREGRLNQFLVKPVSYIEYRFWSGIGKTALETISSLVVIVALMCIFSSSLYIPTVRDVMLSLVVISLGFLLNLYLSVVLGFCAFWMTSVEGFGETVNAIRYFFSGNAFPFDILGRGYQFVATALPFAYLGYIPTQVFLGRMTGQEIFYALLEELAWITALIIIAHILWRFGIKKYEGVGI